MHRALLHLLLIAAALRPQTQDPALVLAEEARSQPVEIYADLAFRLLPRLPERERIEILQEIFERAGEAREAFPSRYSVFSTVDALSLRSRAIRAMLPLDSRQGRRLFESMAHPDVPPATCQDPEITNGAIYIDTVESVFRQGSFTGEERRKGVPWSMVLAAVRQARSSAEIAAAAIRFPSLATSDFEVEQLMAALGSALALQDSDRSFSSLPPARLVKPILELSTRHPSTAMPLLLALRDYLVRHLTAVRCETSVPTPSDGIAGFAEAVAGRTDILPLSESETKAAKREGKPVAAPADPAYLSLSGRVRELSLRTLGEDPVNAPGGPGWNARAVQTLSDVESWRGGTGWELDAIASGKLRLMFQIADSAPRGAVQRVAMNGVFQVLADPLFLQQSPARWLVELEELLLAGGSQSQPDMVSADLQTRLRQLRRHLSGMTNSGREIREMMAASRSPALSLYGRLLLLDHAAR